MEVRIYRAAIGGQEQMCRHWRSGRITPTFDTKLLTSLIKIGQQQGTVCRDRDAGQVSIWRKKRSIHAVECHNGLFSWTKLVHVYTQAFHVGRVYRFMFSKNSMLTLSVARPYRNVFIMWRARPPSVASVHLNPYFQVPLRLESEVAYPGGGPHPSPHKWMLYLLLQGPGPRQFTDRWSDTCSFIVKCINKHHVSPIQTVFIWFL